MKLNVANFRLSDKTGNVVADALQPGNDLKRNPLGYSPGFILLITIVGIALAETIAMAVIYFFRYLPYYQQVLLDAAVMTVIIFPLLYFLSFRPLLQHVQQRYQVERILQTRLQLIQFSNTHTLNELLQFTLDRIEALTGATISFFLFLEPDQKTLGLQAWSTNSAQGQYSAADVNPQIELDQVGIWVDCIRLRQSVIHNNSTSRPFRQEMLEAQAAIFREMAVPVFRDEMIVAVLGLGNKPHDFTKGDVELVSTLADFAWDIVKQKQAEWEIKERNLKAKELTQTIHTMQLDIARDLHDTIGQNISFLRMKLEHLSGNRSIKRSDLQVEIQSMTKAANESYDLIRGTLAVLQSGNSTNLFRLFSRYAEQIEERSGFRVEFSTRGESRQLSAKRLRQIFYVFREALNNIEKHAVATQVSINIDWNDSQLIFKILDNGRGFDRSHLQYGSHFGLKFMRERVEMLNGSMDIQSKVGSGCHIIIQVPYE
jgi:signal transduction histidine kinase